MKAILTNTLTGFLFFALASVSLPAFSADSPWRFAQGSSTIERSCQHGSDDEGGQGTMATGTEEEEEEEEDEYEEPDCD